MKNKDEKIIKKSFKLFFDKFKHHKGRFITTFAITVFAFFCVNFSLSLLNFNQVDGALRTAYANDLQTITLNAVYDFTLINKHDKGYISRSTHSYDDTYEEEQISRLKHKGGVFFRAIRYDDYKCSELFDKCNSHSQGVFNKEQGKYEGVYKKNIFRRFVIVDKIDAETENNLCIKKQTETSRLPNSDGEIAITDFQASIYIKYGFYDFDVSGSKIEIKSYEDMIGKSVGGLTVVGVYSTEDSPEWIKYCISVEDKTGDVDRLADPNMNFYKNLYSGNDNGATTGFLSADFASKSSGKMLLYKLSGNFSKDKKLINSMNYHTAEERVDIRLVTTSKKFYYSVIGTSYSYFENYARPLFVSSSVFASFMLPSFIISSVITSLILLNKLFNLIFGLKKDKHGNWVCDFCGMKKESKRFCLVIWLMTSILFFISALIISIIGFLIADVCCHYYWLQINLLSILEFFLFVLLSVGIITLSTLLKIKKATFIATES